MLESQQGLNIEQKVGTKSDGQSLEPRHARYTLVDTDMKSYLYIPEIQQLFTVSDNDLVNLLRVASDEPESELGHNATHLISNIIRDDKSDNGELSEKRYAHNGLRDVVVHVSQTCNLNCVYCYASELNKANKVMQQETADRVIKQTMLLAPDGLASVKFLGGEPTLAWPVIQHLMEGYLRVSNELSVKPPRFTMVTNGTRMKPHMVRSAAEHGMYILVSIDGDQDIHDELRPTHAGEGSYLHATSTLKSLIDAGVNVAVESVYTRQHYLAGVSPQMMVDHFLSLGVREFQIAPTVGVWHESDTIDQIEEIAELFANAARKSVQSFRTQSPYLLRGIQFVLDGFSLRERRRYVCGAGRTFMGINYDGEAFPCYLLESPDTSYGFIGKDWNQSRYEMIRNRFNSNGKEHHPVCRECWANEICQSCLGTSWQIKPEITKPPAWFCKFQKNIIRAVLAEIACVRDSSEWDIFLVNMDKYLSPLKG